ncbi:MAG: MFS transporter [Actinomycetales bacterium]|nr:MFS transporter [Actinomycetales bacterium]
MASSGAFRALKHRNYRILFPANILSNIGTWAQRVAQDWLVIELTHSATLLGLVTALQFLPSLLLSLYGGVLADRFDKRNLLIITNIGAGLGSAALGLLVIDGVVEIWHVCVLAFTVGVFSALDAPVRTAFNSELVGDSDIASAISLNSATFNGGRLIGPAASGLLIVAFGTGPSFLINALSYVAIVGALLAIRPHDLHIKVKPNSAAKLRQALGYVRRHREIKLVMIAVFFATTFGLNFQIFTALMATNEFGKGPGEFGGLGSILAIGSFTGVLISARLEHLRVPKFVTAGAFAFGLLLIGGAWMPTFETFALALPLTGAVALITLISANSFVQTTCEPALRGRVMGIYLLIFMGGTPIGSPLIGFLAEQIGIRLTIALCGVIVATAGAVIFVILRREPAIEPNPHPETGAISAHLG